METLEKEWTTYPVLHLDLNAQKYDTPEALIHVLEENLQYWEGLYGASESEIGVARRFNGVIRRAAEKTGKNVVVLVDEYDKPMLQAIGNEALLTEYRNTLKAFYGALKSMDAYLRFALLTGVTKFSKISVFSDLNNLEDISLQQAYNTCAVLLSKNYWKTLKKESVCWGNIMRWRMKRLVKACGNGMTVIIFPVMQTVFTIRSVCSMP